MKILLATDGTKHSEAAADMVTKMKLGSEDSVRVISVVDMAVPLAVDIYGGYLPDTAELEKTARESAAKVVEDAIAALNEHLQAAGVKVEGDVLFGSPDSRIVETAAAIDATRAIIGLHSATIDRRLVVIGDVTILDPFADIAVHIEQAPSIRRVLAHRRCLTRAERGVCRGDTRTERVGFAGAGAGGIFPLGFAGQAIA